MISLQDKIYDYLSLLIRDGSADERLPSHNEIRSKFKVSAVTVRHVIEKLESANLIYCRQGKGCFIRKVAENRAHIRLFLILPVRVRISSEFAIGILDIARQERYDMMFFNYSGKDAILEGEIRLFKPDAIIWIAPNTLASSAIIERLPSFGAHVLLFNRILDKPNINYLSSDFFSDGAHLAKLLVFAPGTRVLYVGHDPKTDYSTFRYQGFASGLCPDCPMTSIEFSLSAYHFGGLTKKIGKALLEKEFDVIICSQDALWKDITNAFSEVALKTETLRLGCFDKISEEDPFFPQTRCLVQPIQLMSMELMEGLRDMLNKKQTSFRQLVHSMEYKPMEAMSNEGISRISSPSLSRETLLK